MNKKKALLFICLVVIILLVTVLPTFLLPSNQIYSNYKSKELVVESTRLLSLNNYYQNLLGQQYTYLRYNSLMVQFSYGRGRSCEIEVDNDYQQPYYDLTLETAYYNNSNVSYVTTASRFTAQQEQLYPIGKLYDGYFFEDSCLLNLNELLRIEYIVIITIFCTFAALSLIALAIYCYRARDLDRPIVVGDVGDVGEVAVINLEEL